MLTIRHSRAHNPIAPRVCQICDEPLMRHQVDFCVWHAAQSDLHKCSACHCGIDRPNKTGYCGQCHDMLRNLDDDGKSLFLRKIAIGNMTHGQVFAELSDNRVDLPVARKRKETLPIHSKMLDLVSSELGVSKRRIGSYSRYPEVVRARAVIAQGLLSKGIGVTKIGRIMDGINHATVSNMRDRFPHYCQQDPRLPKVLEKIEAL